MKIINKVFFTTLLFTGINCLCIGQDAPKARIGLTGSGNVTWLKPDINGGFGYERKGLKLGYTGGIQFEIPLFQSPNYAFLTGVNVLYHSGKVNYPDVVYSATSDTLAGNTSMTYKLSYIEVPLMIKLKTNEIGYLTYYGQVGTSIGVKYKARKDSIQTYENSTYEPTENNIDAAKETSLFRFPLIIGAGVEYNLSGNTSIIVGAVFSNGFTNALAWGKKNNPGVYELKEDEKTILLDADKQPTLTGVNRKLLSNYLGLQIGIMF